MLRTLVRARTKHGVGAITAIEIDSTRNLLSGKTSEPVQQIVTDQMVIDHVYNYRDLPLMALFDEFLEILRRTVFGLDREELCGIVAPIVVCGSVIERGIERSGARPRYETPSGSPVSERRR
jgi:hypothetical protein